MPSPPLLEIYKTILGRFRHATNRVSLITNHRCWTSLPIFFEKILAFFLHPSNSTFDAANVDLTCLCFAFRSKKQVFYCSVFSCIAELRRGSVRCIQQTDEVAVSRILVALAGGGSSARLRTMLIEATRKIRHDAWLSTDID